MPAEITDEEILIEICGAPDWITVAAIRDTLATWQPYFPEPFTAPDAHKMLINVSNLYRVLMEAEQKERDVKRDHR